MRIDEAVTAFLANITEERRFSPATRTSYEAELRMLRTLAESRGIADVGGITRELVVDHVGNGSSALAPATRNRKLTVLRSFFGHLVDRKQLAASPAHDVAFSRAPRREEPSITALEVDKLIAVLERESGWRSRRDGAMVLLLFHTGLRLAELLSIDIHQIDVGNALLRDVRRKGGGEMPLPLNSDATMALKRWLKLRSGLVTTTDAVFVSRRGVRLSKRAVQVRVKEIGVEAGIPSLHPHLLRHSFATEILAAGANLEEVRRLLGHASITTTSRYSHPNGAALRRAVDRLARPKRRARR
jgi:integrase/recombinase XerC